MTAKRMWVYDPHSGGRKVPDRIKRDIERRIQSVAREHFAGKYTRLEIRFRGKFCYLDAYTEPFVPEDWPSADLPETRDEYIERLRNTPLHLCRLRYFGDDRWGFAVYTYSNEKYEPAIYPNGEFEGTPEDAFLVAAGLYLGDGPF